MPLWRIASLKSDLGAVAVSGAHLARGDYAAIALLLAMGWVLFSLLARPHVFLYDEADYMHAAEQGLYANYFEPDAIPFQQFIAKGSQHGMRKQSEADLSRFIRASGDLGVYRHYHAPLYFQYVRLLRPVLCPGVAMDRPLYGYEHLIRSSAAICYLALVVIIYLGTLRLAPCAPRASAFLAAWMVVFSPATLTMGTFLSPHALYVMLSTASLLLMAGMLREGPGRAWPVCCVLVGLAVLTIEYGVLLYLTLMLTLWLVQRDAAPRPFWRRKLLLPAKGSLIVLAVILVLWPGGIFRLQLLRCYIVYAYNALVRSADYYGGTGLFALWVHRVFASPAEYAIALIGLCGWAILAVKRPAWRWLAPLAIYPLLQFATSVRNRSELVQYVAAMLPPLYVLGAIMLFYGLRASSMSFRAIAGTGVACLALAGGIWNHLLPEMHSASRHPADEMVATLMAQSPPPKRLVVDQQRLPILSYYLRATDVVRGD